MPIPSSSKLAEQGLYQLRLFFMALQFYTRLPIPRWVGFEAQWLSHASRYFPAVGMIVGSVAAAVYALAAMLWPQPIAVLLSCIAGIYLTGALHEDGFADVCDGFGGGFTRERVLAIMKDPRIGAYGAIGIGLLLALKWLALSSLPPEHVVTVLLVAHPLSRLGPAAMIWKLAYVRHEGKARPLAQLSTAGFMVAAGCALLPVMLSGLAGWLPWTAIAAALVTTVLATGWLARMFVRRIGGYTGDCLGAVQQVTEASLYLGLLAVLTA